MTNGSLGQGFGGEVSPSQLIKNKAPQVLETGLHLDD
jgi:hypothetical protein